MKRALALVCALAALTTSCASIPTSGPVQEGDTDVVQPDPFLPILEGPQPGASPRAIVQGFLTASAGGAVSGFDGAREFLTPEASATWNPLVHVTVFVSRAVTAAYDESSGTFVYSVPVAAVVGPSGVLTEAADDAQAELDFTLTVDEDGTYRISALDNGILVTEADFERFFREVSLSFATPDLETIVPELRWFPANDQIATEAASELVSGASPWLADAVVTGFTAGAQLAVDAVVVDEGIATVALAPGSVGDASQRSLANAQLEATLTQIPQVSQVEATISDSLALGGDGSVKLNNAALPPEAAMVVAGNWLGLFDGESLLVAPDLGAVPQQARSLARAYDQPLAALVLDGDVVVTSLGTDTTFVDYVPGEMAGPEVEIDYQVALAGDDLVAPSYDSWGWLWSTERASQGVVRAFHPDFGELELALPSIEGSTIQEIAVSREGARLAILSRAAGEQSLEVVAISRDSSGVPISLGEPLPVGASLPPSVQLAWSDPVTLAVAAATGEVLAVQIGGWTSEVAVVQDPAALTARNGVRTLHATDVEGTLLVRSGTSWTTRAIGVREVAFAG